MTDTASASTASDIQLGSCVTEIGQGAFSGYTNLTDVEFPDSLTTIGVGAFSGSSVSSIDFNNTETICNNAFANCQNISTLNIGSAVTSIGNSSFQNCSGFTNLTIGSAVTRIGDSAFQNCSGLTSVDIPDNVETIGTNAFYYCRNMVSATIGDGVTSIGQGAFNQNDNMTGATIGSGITSIGSNCFTGSKMKRLNIEATTPPTIAYSGTFGNGSYLIYVPYESYNDYISAQYWSNIKNRIVYEDFPYKVMFMGSDGVENIVPCNSSSSIAQTEVNNSITSGTSKLVFGDCVTEIGQYAFSGNATINEIEWSDSITKIGYEAFSDCKGGIHISSLPSSVTYYDTGAFECSNGNTSIDNLTIGSGVTYVGSYAFEYTTIGNLRIGDFSGTTYDTSPFRNCNISNISFGNQITSTPNAMCYGCSCLTALTIPSNITNISDDSFSRAKDLKRIVFEGNSPTTIGRYAFSNGSFSSITAPNIASIDFEAFYRCSGLTNVSIGGNIPSGYDAYINTETIGKEAFEYLTDGFESLELGSNVTTIGDSSFGSNNNLQKLHIVGNSGTVISGSAFGSCSALTEVIIDNASSISGSQSTSYGSFGYSTNIERVTIGNVSSWDYAFYGRTKISSVTLSNGCTNVGQGTFSGCTSISNVDFPSTLTSIGASAFTNCSGMTTLIIPDSVISIGNNAFQNCSGLTSILVGRSTPPTIGTNVFNGSNCFIYVPQASYDLYVNAENWSTYANRIYAVGRDYKAMLMGGTNMIVNCNDNTTLALSEISSNQASTINIGGCVTAIGASAFTSSYALETVVIPSGVTSIGDYAFYHSSSNLLRTVNGAECVTSIGNDAFLNCSNLTGFTMPSGLTSIGNSAFYGCNSLGGVTLPNTVTSIGNRAFYANLDYVKLTSTTPPEFVLEGQYYENYCFGQSGSTAYPIYVPCSAYETYKTAWNSYNQIKDRIVPFGDYTKQEIVSGEYICDGHVKYEKIENFVSSDEQTWCSVGYTKGNVISDGSDDCLPRITIRYSGNTCNPTTTEVLCENASSTLYPNEYDSSNIDYCDYWSATAITIGDCVTTLSADTQYFAYKPFKTITLPNTITEIPSGDAYSSVFGECSATTINIGNAVTSIGNYAFNKCRNLKRLNSNTDGVFNIPNSVTTIGGSAFASCSGLTSINIPSGVTSIGSYAFSSCSGLTSINIPSGVTYIGSSAFSSCRGLTSITVNATTPPIIGYYIFDNTNNCPIYVPTESVEAYKAATNWSDYANRIQAIPNS